MCGTGGASRQASRHSDPERLVGIVEQRLHGAPGRLFAQVAAMLVPGLPFSPAMGAIVGMAAFFTGVVRAPFTGALLVLGMTGTMTPLLPILAASVAATIVPYALGNAPIYDTLRARMPHPNASHGPAPTQAASPPGPATA